MSRISIVWAALAAVCAAAAVFLGWHHPLAPGWCLAATLLVALASARWPTLWLVLVPAGLPWLDFSPWTGWLMVQEFDLLLLAVFTGGFARLAFDRRRNPGDVAFAAQARQLPGHDSLLLWLMLALVLSLIAGLVRGLPALDALQPGWFQGYADPLNTLRVAKSLVFALLTVPLLGQALACDRAAAGQRLLLGMALGLAVVALAALWERVAYAGLTDFSVVYRVTALFWEMHVGGAAIDAYLAMASPFAILLLVRSRTLWPRLLAALLLAALAYTCLTTFSRGVYVAVAVPLLLVAVVRTVQSDPPRASATAGTGRQTGRVPGWPWWLLALLGALVWSALGPESFLSNRLAYTDKVWAGRLQHWDNSLALLRSRSDWWWGLGLGRFPSAYAGAVPRRGFSGSATHQPAVDATPAHATLRGTAAGEKTAGLYALTQRVPALPGVRYQFTAQLRAAAPVDVVVQVCERHLLYDWDCQGRLLRVGSAGPGWQSVALWLDGEPFSAQPWFAPRLAMFSVSVASALAQIDMANLGLTTQHGQALLTNGHFSLGLARWFPAAQYYFVPWHTDSFYLELLVERGLLGLLPTMALMLFAAVRVRSLFQADPGLALCLWASLAGAALLGVVGSFLDVPRVAWLFYLLCFYSIGAGQAGQLVVVASPAPGAAANAAV